MLIGHYAVAFALKKAEPKASLGLLFLGVQLADILFFPFFLLGIESLNVIPDLAEASAFELDSAPFSHGLLGALVTAVIIAAIFRQLISKNGSRNMLAIVMGVAIVSNQQKWDTLGAERSGAGWRSGELPEGTVVASSPFGGLSLHLLPAL